MVSAVSALIADATTGTVTPVSLAGVTVPVLHPSMWPPGAVVALADGAWHAWAALCTADDGESWTAADPSTDDLRVFSDDLEEALGQRLQDIADVVSVLDNHAAAVTADLRRWYNVDVRWLWATDAAIRVSHTHVRHLLDHLPPESAYKTALRDRLTSKDFQDAPEPDGWGPWSRTEELLAVLIDHVNWLQYATLAAAGGNPPEPVPFRRPGVGQSGRERRIHAALTAAHVQYLRDHDGAAPPPGWDHGVDAAAIN